MLIITEKLTNLELLQRVCSTTIKNKTSKVTLDKMYKCEHSPIRTQIFLVEMKGIPTFVSVHLVRHSVGVTHFVESNREDRGGSKETNRYTPVNHSMLINAQALINISRKRLCKQASKETREVWEKVVESIKEVDSELYPYLVPECKYRNGICPELKPCTLNS